jgi:hypothetical protein
MRVRSGVVLALLLAVAAPAGADRPKGKKGSTARDHGAVARGSAPPPLADPRATLRPVQALLEAVAAGKRVTTAEQRRLRSLLRDPQGDVAAVAAWALTRVREKRSLAEMEVRRDRRRKLPGFAGSVEEAFLRLAPIRMRRLSPARARAVWGRLLKSDPNPYVRAEAAREVARHPQALQLLRGAIAWARTRSDAERGAVLSQAAYALRLVGAAAVPDLRAMVHETAYPHFPYGNLVELAQCQTFMKVPCGELETYLSVNAYARRGLALLTGESERDRENLR